MSSLTAFVPSPSACATPAQDAKPQIINNGTKLNFWLAVDDEIERLRGPDCPCALWLEEIAPIYHTGLSPAEAAHLVLERREVRRADAVDRRLRGPVSRLFDFWSRRKLRRAGLGRAAR